jgi:hypothetical protein
LSVTVRELVQHRLRVGPQPGERPQQAPEKERQQTEHLDSVALRVMALVRDLLGQHMDHPEQDDEDDRHHDDHDQCENARHLVERLAFEEGGVRGQRREAG